MEELVQFLVQLLFVLSDPLLVVVVELLILLVHVEPPSLGRKRAVIFMFVRRRLESELRDLREGSLGLAGEIPETRVRGNLFFHFSLGW